VVAFSTDFTWTAVLVIFLLLATFVFLAILWSRREWNTRKIRVGLFLEREYREDDEEPPDTWEDDSPTAKLRREMDG
jgi:hypothetical protein